MATPVKADVKCLMVRILWLKCLVMDLPSNPVFNLPKARRVRCERLHSFQQKNFSAVNSVLQGPISADLNKLAFWRLMPPCVLGAQDAAEPLGSVRIVNKTLKGPVRSLCFARETIGYTG
jgi:hypothetical protein